jgi:hypothetical protein
MVLNLSWIVDLDELVAENEDARVDFRIREDGRVGIADLKAKRLAYVDYELAADARRAFEQRARAEGRMAQH